jgi:hypothetical protein
MKTPRKNTKKKPVLKKVVKKTPAKKKRVAYNKKMTIVLFKKICKEIEETHLGLKTICTKLNTSSSAFFDILDSDKKNDLPDLYARARERQGDYLFDEQREVVYKRDEDHTPFTGTNVIQRDRLIADTLKWQAGKLRPKKYGDSIDLTTKGDKIEIPLFPDVSKNNSDK